MLRISRFCQWESGHSDDCPLFYIECWENVSSQRIFLYQIHQFSMFSMAPSLLLEEKSATKNDRYCTK